MFGCPSAGCAGSRSLPKLFVPIGMSSSYIRSIDRHTLFLLSFAVDAGPTSCPSWDSERVWGFWWSRIWIKFGALVFSPVTLVSKEREKWGIKIVGRFARLVAQAVLLGSVQATTHVSGLSAAAFRLVACPRPTGTERIYRTFD